MGRRAKLSPSLHTLCFLCLCRSYSTSCSGWVAGRSWMEPTVLSALISRDWRLFCRRFASLDWWVVMSTITWRRKQLGGLSRIELSMTRLWYCPLAWICVPNSCDISCLLEMSWQRFLFISTAGLLCAYGGVVLQERLVHFHRVLFIFCS